MFAGKSQVMTLEPSSGGIGRRLKAASSRLTSIAAKHLSATWEGLPSIDWELATEIYLNEYEKLAPLDRTHLETYRVRRCLLALIQGTEGQQVWQYPPIVADIVAYIREVTGVRITLPA